ncbi:antibiotic biosynthesis monooxygenase [Sulfurimonas hongkongensis]|uniref:Antibiotic biosynthesis monooxygenase n=1 Tax=Sulfurimonas hongkongensis TaxID=1172190 RepID=T0J0S7_9BACT|nr:putative quinol monooxygenase [Sulfurimonas hongkongensis]EQB34625.1 antibiotic biosynthesis monooxygenase [Sulfurimonas hongkongensis]
MSSITKRVTFIAKEGSEAKMKELLSAMVIPSKAEDGCIFYDIFQYENNPRKFMAVESWRDETALDGHKASAHYAVYKSSYEPFCEHKYSDELEILG